MTFFVGLSILGLVALFFAMGRVAAIAVESVQVLSHKIGVPVAFLGVLLGLFTTLPELGIGVSAVFLNETPEISMGNLLGGGMVVLGLVLGLSLLLNKKIKTDGKLKHIAPIACVTFLPFLFLIVEGVVGVAGAVIMLAFYFLMLIRLYCLDGAVYKHPKKVEKGIFLPIGRLILAILLILVFAEFTMRLTLFLLTSFSAPAFLVGLILFPIGTNLPEIAIVFISWRRKLHDISMANLFGSAMANTPVMGALALFTPLSVSFTAGFYVLIITNFLLLVYLVHAYLTGKRFSRSEGVALVAFYAVYVFFMIRLA